MKKNSKTFFYLVTIGFVFWGLSNLYIYKDEKNVEPLVSLDEEEVVPQKTEEPKKIFSDSERVNLPVPYISEAPEGKWIGPWKNACEEATIAMVDKYYKKEKVVTIAEAKIVLQRLFDIQDKEYGSNANSDATRTAEIINKNFEFTATVITDPTIDDIKKELDEGRPIIAFHRGFDLKNKNIPFLATGSSYHTTVIKGYDDKKSQFITNDPGDEIAGRDRVYEYNLFMNSIHDYDYERKLADGPKRVIFTSPKILGIR